MKFILFILLSVSFNCLANDGVWIYQDGWVFKTNTNDPTAGGAVIQKKITKEEKVKYNTINGERYVTTAEWKKIMNLDNENKAPEKICLHILTADVNHFLGFVPKGPEPSASGLFQLGLVIAFYAHRFLRKR